MSEQSEHAGPQGVKPLSKITEAVIRIAGNSQDGIQAIGGFLARLAGRSEQDVMTFMTIPSTISGGPSIFQVRIGTGEVRSAGDEADLLLAFYQHSYKDHIGSLKKGGIVLYDSDHVTPDPELVPVYHHVGVPISGLTVEAIGGTGREKGKNIFALGLLAKMFDLNVPKIERLINERFAGKDTSVAETAVMAFNSGYAYSVQNLVQTFQFLDTETRGTQVVMNGNEAIAYGFLAAGVRFGAAYPITPWSDVMEIMRRELPKYGGSFIQCEDEIAAMCMAIGASYGGRVAVTGSSGPGISLKTEAIGWAVMAEMPVVIVDVQRGGPSTGLPTHVEQSDFNIACFGGHGDAPRVVLAPGNVEDCFYTAIEAVNIARKYSVPVIILTDQAIGTRIEAFVEPDLKNLVQDMPPDCTPVAEHKPYDLSAPDGITRHLPPGTRIGNGIYPVVTGLEHDEMGHPTGSPKMHMRMMAKRRNKLRVLACELPRPVVYGPAEGDVLLVGWGSTMGPLHEVVDRAKGHAQTFSTMNIRALNPLPDGLEEIFRRFRRIFVVELNDEGIYGHGQFATLLRSRYLIDFESITKTDGLAFRVREILEQVQNRLAVTAN